jgi:Leu/Phe-tRNA-protein transferase
LHWKIADISYTFPSPIFWWRLTSRTVIPPSTLHNSGPLLRPYGNLDSLKYEQK